MVTANLPAYLSTWSDEILSRADRVRHLIGSRHWPSDGSYKEALIREFLIRHLPSELNIAKGFIRQLNEDLVSPEVDLLIADPRRHVPIFHECELQIVPPSSVLATMEVKSSYKSSVLRDAIANVIKVRQVTLNRRSDDEIWSAVLVISAPSPLSAQELLHDIKDAFVDESLWKDALKGCGINRPQILVPNIICVLDSCIAFAEPDPEGSVALKAFFADRLSGALMFAQLFGYLRAILSAQHTPGELDSILERCEGLQVCRDRVSLPRL